MLLDARRTFVPNSFDFVIKTIGVYENKELVKKACIILQNKYVQLIEAIDSDTLSILNSEVSFEHSYDVKLENEDYTVGTVLEYIRVKNSSMAKKHSPFAVSRKYIHMTIIVLYDWHMPIKSTNLWSNRICV